jgi:integrase
VASVQRRGAAWRAQIFRQGRRESRTFENEQEAWDWARSREQELADGIAVQVSQSWVGAANRWAQHRTLSRSDETRLRAISALSWAVKPIAAVTRQDISDWRDARLSQVSPATVAREMNMVGSVLQFARRDLGWIVESPMRDVRRPQEPPARRRLIVADEVAAMLEQLGWAESVETVQHEVAAAMLFALETAMRAGEVLGLTWDRVQPRKVLLEKTKNGDRREVPLSTRAVALLELMRGKRLRHVRVARADGRVWHIDTETLDQLFRRARKDAGLSGFTFHDTRATALTRLAQVLSPLELARMVGHRDLKSLMFYYAEPAESLAEKLG